MSRRIIWAVTLVLSGGGGGACAHAAESVRDPASNEPIAPSNRESARPVEPPGVTLRPLDSAAPGYVMWCASGGAPIVGAPVVDEQERSYVATSDGYLHAFERDGRFRWSYTVKGTPLGSVSLRPSDGAILIGTTGRFIYAINQDGSLRFRYPTLTPVWSGLHALNPSTVVFLGHDTRLYAISNSGARKYRVRAPSGPMGEPVVAANDVVWLPLEDGVARFESAYRLERFALPGPAEQVAVLGGGVVARAVGHAYFVARDGSARDLGPARLLSGDGERVVIVSKEGEALLMGPSLVPRPIEVRADVLADLSAAPRLVGDQLWCPLDGGRLAVLGLSGGHALEIPLDMRKPTTPVVGPSGRWALVPSQGGDFCAVEIASDNAKGSFAPKLESSANSVASVQ